MTADASTSASSTGGAPPLVVYWRPGCGFCMRLRRALDKAEVTHELRNIWEDDDARSFVAAHNRGNETVPTVALGDVVETNPDPGRFLARLVEERPELVGKPDAVGGGGWRDRLKLF